MFTIKPAAVIFTLSDNFGSRRSRALYAIHENTKAWVKSCIPSETKSMLFDRGGRFWYSPFLLGLKYFLGFNAELKISWEIVNKPAIPASPSALKNFCEPCLFGTISFSKN